MNQEACCRVLLCIKLSLPATTDWAALPLAASTEKNGCVSREADSAFIRSFWTEWLTMAAQIARRGWRNENRLDYASAAHLVGV